MADPSGTSGLWVPDEGELWFSDRFNVDPAVLEEHGAYDISVVTDTPLFVDPFLLFNSEDDKYQALHEQMLFYLRFLKEKAPLPLHAGLVHNWFAFHEVKQNWLGFTEDSNAGHGLGAGFARDLRDAFQNLLRDFGQETITDSSHLEKLALLSDGVGRDTISDFTTNLIKHYLCKYTEEFAKKHIDAELCDTFAVTKAALITRRNPGPPVSTCSRVWPRTTSCSPPSTCSPRTTRGLTAKRCCPGSTRCQTRCQTPSCARR